MRDQPALLAEDAPALDVGGPVPNSLAGLRELARRLEQGLAMVESQGGLASGDHALTQRRLEQVVGFANAVNSTLKLDTVIDRALALVIEIAGAERGLLLLKEGVNLGTQRYLTAPGFADEGGGGEQYSRTVARTVLDTGETVCVLDALSDQRFAQQASVMGLNLQTIICVPLKDQDETIGAIYVDRQGLSDQFATSDLETVQALASLTAQAIVNAKLMRAQEERQVHLEMLNRLSRTLSRTLDLEKVLDLIADITIEVTKAERTFILLVENDQLVFGAGRDQDGPLPPQAGREMSRSICQKVMDTQQSVFVIDAGSDEEFAAKKSVVNLKLNSVVAVPLIGQGGITGVLYVDSRSRVVKALEKEVSVLTAIANTAALAVDNARLYRQATVDGLTSLYVRSFFLLRMDEEIRRTKRFGGKFSLLVMDIDHFKKFNDTYGHATGDAVLKQVAKTIRDCVRVGLDLPCRYGGEEMVVLLPETDTPGALVTAERIRREIEATALAGPEGEQLRVTISIGIATFPAMAETASDLFERADQALYASKHGGRNRSTIYQVEAGTTP
jgi:diguanylate cyclase (GGDEF)-like protein